MKAIFLVTVIAVFGETLGYHLGGTLQDTPEVAHAKAEHFAAMAKAKAAQAAIGSQSGWNRGDNWSPAPHQYEEPTPKYHGPIALPPGYDKYGAPLPVLDTHEVAHAKAYHLAALTKAGGHIYPSVHDERDYLSSSGQGQQQQSGWSSESRNDDGQYRPQYNSNDDGQYRPQYSNNDNGQYQPRNNNNVDDGQYHQHYHYQRNNQW